MAGGEDVATLPEDREAVRELVDREGAAGDALEQYARLHAEQGDARFRLMHGLREPRTVYEQAERDHYHGRITWDGFLTIVRAADKEPVNATMLRAYYEDVDWSIAYYHQLLVNASRLQPPSSKSAEYLLREMQRKGSLGVAKHRQITEFVEDARASRSLGVVEAGRARASHAALAAVQCMAFAAEFWLQCREIAERSRTDRNYVRQATVEELFLQAGLPNAATLEALLREEAAVARQWLAQRDSPAAAPLVQNTFHVDGDGNSVAPNITISAADAVAPQNESGAGNRPGQKKKPPRPDARPRLSNWAIGLDEQRRWLLFHQRSGRWEQSIEVKIPGGNPHDVLELLANEGGAMSRADVHRCLKKKYCDVPSRKLTRTCTYALQKAKAAVRQAIAEIGRFEFSNVPNPIPFDEPTWRAEIAIGFVVEDDDGRPVFRTRDELQPDERIDGP